MKQCYRNNAILKDKTKIKQVLNKKFTLKQLSTHYFLFTQNINLRFSQNLKTLKLRYLLADYILMIQFCRNNRAITSRLVDN